MYTVRDVKYMYSCNCVCIEVLYEFFFFQIKLKEVVLSNQSSPLPQKRDCKCHNTYIIILYTIINITPYMEILLGEKFHHLLLLVKILSEYYLFSCIYSSIEAV